MYKWHAHSGIGRSRPLASDFLRVTDGIATSLRQFSISASRAEEESPLRITRVSAPISRAQRSANAVDQLASLPAQRVDNRDARAPVTSPSQGFTIRRMDDQGGNHVFDPANREQRVHNPSQGSGSGSSYVRSRDREGGGGDFQRGGRGGRGRGRGDRGRGKARGGRRREKREKDEPEIPESEEPLTDQELQARRHFDGNFADGPYEPGTNLQGLLKYGTPTIGSPQGLLQNVVFKMQTGTDTWRKGYEPPNMHRYKLAFGGGVAVFEGTQEAKYGKKWLTKKTASAKEYRVPGGLKSFTEEDLQTLSNTWAAGHHELPEMAPLDDVLGQVKAYTRRNGTYLDGETSRLEDKLRELLPAQTKKSVPRQTAKKP